MKTLKHLSVLGLLAMALALPAAVHAVPMTFQAFLSGLDEVPPNGSLGSGFGTVVLNDAQTQITVNMNWAGLTTSAMAGHIHGPAPAGVNAGIIFPLVGVVGNSGAIPEQTFAINPTQVGYLFGGLLYMNVHTTTFPGGEIRGQLVPAVPETGPGIIGLLTVLAMLALPRWKAARVSAGH